ncbi:uncharacterized protein ChrSV_p0015 (plasmid) [Chromobacterium vaccinii]|nr:uncharacterized protein ChrSW_p0015 [Chromobacterium vaccinii]QND87433.1 uncharacterized protein ChrSV_p0015 [Chromobacterium vaccinii]
MRGQSNKYQMKSAICRAPAGAYGVGGKLKETSGEIRRKPG